MSLVHEATRITPGYSVGDVKIASYDIVFTAKALTEPEPGWFLLNGAVISQAAYPTVFARFGTTYNTGSEGVGNFRLPDHTEGIFPIARGLTSFATYGATGGEINHTLAASEMPVHNHASTLSVAAQAHTHSVGASMSGDNHSHTYTLGLVAGYVWAGGQPTVGGYGTSTTPGGGALHTHAVSISSPNGASTTYSATETFNKSGSVSNSTGGSAHNNMMPYVVIGGLLVKHD